MIFSTTPTLEGHPIREYRGVVTGETIIGANVFKDFMAGLRDFFGGRSGTYESVLREAKDSAMREMAQRAESLGCNAIVGIDLDYETVGQGGWRCGDIMLRGCVKTLLFQKNHKALTFTSQGFAMSKICCNFRP